MFPFNQAVWARPIAATLSESGECGFLGEICDDMSEEESAILDFIEHSGQFLTDAIFGALSLGQENADWVNALTAGEGDSDEVKAEDPRLVDGDVVCRQRA